MKAEFLSNTGHCENEGSAITTKSSSYTITQRYNKHETVAIKYMHKLSFSLQFVAIQSINIQLNVGGTQE